MAVPARPLVDKSDSMVSQQFSSHVVSFEKSLVSTNNVFVYVAPGGYVHPCCSKALPVTKLWEGSPPKEACTVRGAHVGDKMMGMYSSARKFGLVTLWEVRDMHEQPWQCASSYSLTCYPIAPLTSPSSSLFLEDDWPRKLVFFTFFNHILIRTNYCSQRIFLKIVVTNFYRV